MVIVIDPQIAGISGDMLLSSLVDCGANKNKIIDGINSIENFLADTKLNQIDFLPVKKHGIQATQLILKIDEQKHERKAIEIQNCINKSAEKLGLSEKATSFANQSVNTLIKAEASVHGVSIESVHLHEASSFDTVVDIIGTAIALDDLNYFSDEIITCPVAVGGGSITFSHGTISNPASAILEIFKNSNIQIKGGSVSKELTTPTGASMLVSLTNTCSKFYPSMTITNTGYGAGKMDFDSFSNVLKIVKGNSDKFQSDSVHILETNVDDVSGEVIGNLIEKLMHHGAKDVSILNALTKKGRPSFLVSVICDSISKETLLDVLISETNTLGVRVRESERVIVPRQKKIVSILLSGKAFQINVKTFGNDFKNFKIESDDIILISSQLNKGYMETERLLKNLVQKKLDES